jgi:uncharacterized protein (DUF433 family)
MDEVSIDINDESQLTNNTNPNELLKKYAMEAKIKALAYKYSEIYNRNLYKCLTYPLIILSSTTTVLAGLKMNDNLLMGLSLAMVLFSGFNQAINTKNKEHDANRISVEMSEIESNINHFLHLKTDKIEDAKAYSETVHELLKTWKSMEPPIKNSYINAAIKECTGRPTITNYISLRRMSFV